MLASPLQMARFYALLANGGKLVTPHVVSAIEQPGPRNGPSQGARCSGRCQAPTQELNLDPGAITAIRDGSLRGDALGARHLGEHLRQLPGRDRRQDGNRRDARRIRAQYAVRRPRRGGAVSARSTRRRLVVCAVIENGGFGGAVAAPAALQVFEQFFGKKATNDELGADGLMVDYAADRDDSRSANARRAREARTLRNLDWVLLAAVGGIVAYGLWVISGITKDDIPGNPNYYVVRQAAYALVGCAGPGRDDAPRARLLAQALADRLRRPDRACSSSTPVLGSQRPHTRRWIDFGPFRFQPSEFGKLLLVLFLAAFLADRGKRIYERQTTLAAVGFAARADDARLPAARLRDGDRVRGNSRRDAVHRRARAGRRWRSS